MVKNNYKHKKILLCIMITVIALFILFKFAYVAICDNKIDSFLNKIEKNNKKINSISVDYINNVFLKSTQKKIKICGKLFFKKKYGIYINQKEPQEQQLYFNSNNIIVYTPKDKQAIIINANNCNSVISNENFIFSDFFLYFVNIYENFKQIKKTNIINFMYENEEHALIKLIDRSKKSYNADLYISKINMFPEKIIIKSKLLNMEIIFNNCVMNSILNENIFKLNTNGIRIVKI
ncbi:MAG: outer membrane lipoprotein carrier protein LolA [Endomicrobium sp.]|jgi:outer membrane lipoprotein-sorting protein|nr:outer membrane lipoprotein carrier protein LolA [Endomicrobium sp.]